MEVIYDILAFKLFGVGSVSAFGFTIPCSRRLILSHATLKGVWFCLITHSSPCAQTWYLFQVELFRSFTALSSVMLNKVDLLWASSHIGCMDFAFISFR